MRASLSPRPSPRPHTTSAPAILLHTPPPPITSPPPPHPLSPPQPLPPPRTHARLFPIPRSLHQPPLPAFEYSHKPSIGHRTLYHARCSLVAPRLRVCLFPRALQTFSLAVGRFLRLCPPHLSTCSVSLSRVGVAVLACPLVGLARVASSCAFPSTCSPRALSPHQCSAFLHLPRRPSPAHPVGLRRAPPPRLLPPLLSVFAWFTLSLLKPCHNQSSLTLSFWMWIGLVWRVGGVARGRMRRTCAPWPRPYRRHPNPLPHSPSVGRRERSQLSSRRRCQLLADPRAALSEEEAVRRSRPPCCSHE